MIEKLFFPLKQKKRKAQQEFYDRYSNQMFLLTYRYVNNEQDAGSVVNIGFFNFFSNWDKFSYINERALVSQMKKIIINEALKFLRSKIAYDDIDETKSDIFNADNISENNLLLEDYYNLIKKLPSDLRTVFNLFVIEGFSHKEIAEKLFIKESSSRVYLTRARKILQKKITLNQYQNGNNNLDDLFKNKINQINGLTKNVNWNSKKGWDEYQKQFKSKNKQNRKLFLYISSIAAPFILAFFSIIHYQNSKNKLILVTNQTSKVNQTLLPDGNKVWLNKKSSVEYLHKTNKELYKLTVNGEVYVELSKKRSKKYIIKANNAIISTETLSSINVRAYTEEPNVDITVNKGIIKVMEKSYEQGMVLLVTQGNYCSVHKTQNIIF